MDVLRVNFIAPTIVGVLFAVVTLVYFYIRSHRRYQLFLALMFGSHLVSLLFQALNILFPQTSYVFFYSLFQLIAASFALRASFEITKNEVLKYFLLLPAGGSIFLAFSILTGFTPNTSVLVSYITTGICIALSGFSILRVSRHYFEKLFAAALLLWGLHKLDYPFLIKNEELRIIGYFLSGLLILLNVYAVIALLYEEREEEITEKSNLINYVLENIPDIIARVGVFPEPTLVWVSPNVERILGYNSEELKKPGFIRRIADEDVLNDILNRITKSKKGTIKTFLPLKDTSGKVRFFEVSVSRTSSGSNEGSFYDVVLTEATRVKELEDDIFALEAMMWQLNFGIIVFDQETKVRYANEFMEVLTGVERGKLIGKSLNEIKENLQALDLFSIYESCFKKSHVDIKVAVGNPERIFRCMANILRDSEGKITGVVLIFRDITETVQLEEYALRNQTVEEIRKNIGAIVHDLKNMLAPAIAGLSFLNERKTLAEEDRKIIEESLNSLIKANDLSKELLEVTSTIKVNYDKLTLDEVINAFQQALTFEERKRLKVSSDLEIKHIYTDEKLLCRAISNILRNAFDVSPKDETVWLRVLRTNLSPRNHLLLPAGSYIVFSVSDKGPGIPKELLKDLFKPFVSMKKGSAGLGLFIAYSFIQNLGGTIDVKSEPGKGTTFELYIPELRTEQINDPNIAKLQA